MGMDYEFRTTTCNTSVREDKDFAVNAGPKEFPTPAGSGWELVTSAVSEGTVYYTWKRLKRQNLNEVV